MAGPAGGGTRVRTDLAYYGVVTRVISATQFVAGGLAGMGDGALVGYAAYVLAKADGTVTAPHGEQPAVTVYVSSTGTFTHPAYTAPVAVGDQVLLLHPNIGAALALTRQVAFMDFWSIPENLITITNVALDRAFPDIVVAGLPTGVTVQRAVLIFMCRAINNLSGAANYINAANRTLRIKISTGAWGVADVVGITFDNQSLYCLGGTKEAGLPIIGSINLNATVTGNGTYNVATRQTASADALVALAASLELYDIQVGLRVFYS